MKALFYLQVHALLCCAVFHPLRYARRMKCSAMPLAGSQNVFWVQVMILPYLNVVYFSLGFTVRKTSEHMFTNFATYLPNDLEHFFPGDTFPACNVLCFIALTIQWLILVNMGILGHCARRDVPIFCISS